MLPIGQALAPYLTAGCCAVAGLVPHALCIGVFGQFYDNTYASDRQGKFLLVSPKKGLTSRNYYAIITVEDNDRTEREVLLWIKSRLIKRILFRKIWMKL